MPARSARTAAVIISVLIALAGCGQRPMPSVAPDPSSAGCRAAFAALEPGTDAIIDLYPAVRRCTSVAMWVEAFQAHGGLGFDNTSEEILRQVCARAEVAQEVVCGRLDL